MSLLSLIISIVVVGIILYVINSFLPMDATVKKILNCVVILLLVVYLLKVFGVWAHLASMHI